MNSNFLVEKKIASQLEEIYVSIWEKDSGINLREGIDEAMHLYNKWPKF